MNDELHSVESEDDEESLDADDFRLLRAARAENEGKPRLTHEEMMRELGLST